MFTVRKEADARVLSEGDSMRNIILFAFIAGVLTGCSTMTEKERVAWLNADPRIWPPVVEGQPFPVQMMNDPD